MRGDANADGTINISDGVYSLNFLFTGGDAPPTPFPGCALDPDDPDNEELLKGKHFVGIGSYKPEVREFPPSLYNLLETIYIDTHHALKESGDLIVPLKNGWITSEQITTIGKYLQNPQPRPETTFFKSVGMALFDVCAAKLIYEKAKQSNLGQKIDP